MACFFFFWTIEIASLQKHIDDMVVLYCKYVDEGGLGVLPQKFFVLNGVKSCNSGQAKYEMPFYECKEWEVGFFS